MKMIESLEFGNIAHIDETGRIQSLEEHLYNTARLAGSFGSAIGIGRMAYLTGLIHDIGKAHPDFFAYILGYDPKQKRGDVIHSTAGAQLLRILRDGDGHQCLASEMAEIAVMSHHTGLIDCLTPDGIDNFDRRLHGQNFLKETLHRIDEGLLLHTIHEYAPAVDELSALIQRIIISHADGSEKRLRLGLLIRMILSCLVDADRIDTASFVRNEEYMSKNTDWRELSRRLEEHLGSVPKDTPIDRLRHRISEGCLESSSRPRGAYSLTAPTGGGKTISGFRFALNHLIVHGMRRIVVVSPYLSVIDQNAAVIKGILERDGGAPIVTECHSNVDVGDGDTDAWDSATDSWDGPVIFTTMVQFLETFYSSGTRKVRRMHNLANAVIIFDEIQCLPVKVRYLFNAAVNFLTQHCGSSVVLTSATQPLLHRTERFPLIMDKEPEIVPDTGSLFQSMRHTRIWYANPGAKAEGPGYLADLAKKCIGKHRNVLVIVNTKRMAKEVFLHLRSRGRHIPTYHLSTDMCPRHRRDRMEEIREGLESNGRLICVSTQVLETGADMDFDMVIRSLAGLDSIVQAAGRCNRHGRRAVGDVIVVKTDEELGPLVDIYEGRRVSDAMLGDGTHDPADPATMDRYYEMFSSKRTGDMAYPVGRGEDLCNMLSSNSNAVHAYRSINGRNPPLYSRQSFRTANSIFSAIGRMQSIIVPYDDTARRLISEIGDADPTCSDPKATINALQQYSVNTYRLDEAIRQGIVYEIVDGSSLYCLREGHYDADLGFVLGKMKEHYEV